MNGKTVAVYDLGGGTFDISVLEFNEGVFEVKATNGNSSLGGEDFDQRITRYLLQHLGQNASNDPATLQRLKEAAEIAKHELSTLNETEINLPFLGVDITGKPLHLRSTLSRTQLEEMCADLINATIKPCEKCMKDAGVRPKDIGEIILVGGMTRMPRVAEVVKDIFGKPPCRNVNPDEAVALGAVSICELAREVKSRLL